MYPSAPTRLIIYCQKKGAENKLELLKFLKNLVIFAGNKLISDRKLKKTYFVMGLFKMHLSVNLELKHVQSLFEKTIQLRSLVLKTFQEDRERPTEKQCGWEIPSKSKKVNRNLKENKSHWGHCSLCVLFVATWSSPGGLCKLCFLKRNKPNQCVTTTGHVSAQ